MTDITSQINFFNVSKNQYDPRLIIKTPYHTVLEINEILTRIKANRAETVLDFGAGSGRITIPLLQKGFSVWAVDTSMKSLENLKKFSEKLGLKSLIVSSSIPKGKKFNTIVGADVLHHVSLDEYLPKLFNSLEEGGKIVFSEPCAFNLSWYVYLPIASSWEVEKGLLSCTYINLKNKLKKNGFRNIEITGLGVIPRPFLNFSKTLCKVNDRLGNLPVLKMLAYRYIVEAEK